MLKGQMFSGHFFLLANLNVLPLIRYSPDVYKFPLGKYNNPMNCFKSCPCNFIRYLSHVLNLFLGTFSKCYI